MLIHPTAKEVHALLDVWEKSVRVTHAFLKPGDVEFYRPFVAEFIPRLKIYVVKEGSRIVAFMGLDNCNIEMLFVRPEHRCCGYGSALVDIAVFDEDVRTVDVNEQNGQAVGFYLDKGFEVVGRDGCDSFGKPYPVLHLRLPHAETISAGRLVLRAFTSGDLKDFHRLCSDPALGSDGGWKPHESEDESRIVMRRYFLNRKDVWAVERKADGALIGAVGFNADTRRENTGARSLGYWLGREYWGNGYMAEAAKAAIAYARDTSGAEIITATCFTGNMRSRRVLEKCGFVMEGTIHAATRDAGGRLLDEYAFYIPY